MKQCGSRAHPTRRSYTGWQTSITRRVRTTLSDKIFPITAESHCELCRTFILSEEERNYRTRYLSALVAAQTGGVPYQSITGTAARRCRESTMSRTDDDVKLIGHIHFILGVSAL